VLVAVAGGGCARAALDTAGFEKVDSITVNAEFMETWQAAKQVLREYGIATPRGAAIDMMTGQGRHINEMDLLKEALRRYLIYKEREKIVSKSALGRLAGFATRLGIKKEDLENWTAVAFGKHIQYHGAIDDDGVIYPIKGDEGIFEEEPELAPWTLFQGWVGEDPAALNEHLIDVRNESPAVAELVALRFEIFEVL